MSKIICDVCGTSFAETATHCPICGCVRPTDSVAIDTDQLNEDNVRSAGYSYVKGGRFSSSNVKRRSSGKKIDRTPNKRAASEPDDSGENNGDKGLIAAVCLLLVAIVCVVIYIVVHFFGGQPDIPVTDPNNGQSVVEPSASTTEATIEQDLSCTAIVLSQTAAELEIGGTVQLSATITPEDTTDQLTFVSANEAIVKVSADGKIEAVAAGETTVTATCGEISAVCNVVVKAPVQTEDPTQSTDATEPTTEPDSEFTGPFKTNKTDVAIVVDETFQIKLLDSKKNVVPVTWTVEDSDICTVDGNVVKGKSVGKTTISVTYEGETYSCIVRVRGDG